MLGVLILFFSGAVGGNIAGKALKKFDLGVLGNSAAGFAGGGLGGQLLGILNGGGELEGLLAPVASGGIGGAVALTLVGIVRAVMSRG
jgi:hypothetical protein